MPQWVQLPPNLLPEKHTSGKSIYTTDYSSKRPGFQIHLQRTRGAHHSHHPRPPKDADRKAMRARQTGSYMSFKQDLERALSAAEGTKRPSARLGIASPKTLQNAVTPSDRAVIQKFMKPSLEKVQQAWTGEAQAVKRDRDRAYGMAGKRLDLHRKADKQEAKQASELPGLNNWLHSSNEYEKAVVYNFIDSVAKATNDRPAGKTEAPKEKGATTHRRFANEYYYKQRAKSAHSQRTTERFQLPPRPHSVGAIRHEDEAAEESGEEHGTEYAPCHPHHTEGKCEFCDYMRVKKLLEDLNRLGASGLGETTISHLLRPRGTQPNPTYEDYDYTHENSFFTNTIAKDRGYFIIAPDWVSEKKGIPPPRYRYY